MYERFEKYTVNPIPGKGYEVLGHFKDDVHDINSRILFDYRSYRVIEAEVHTSNLPFPICQSGLDKIKDIIGVPAGPGFNRTVKERLGGSSGCIHLAEMVMNSMQAGLQAASRGTPDWMENEYYQAEWAAWEQIFKGSCIYFSQPDALKNLRHKVHNELGPDN